MRGVADPRVAACELRPQAASAPLARSHPRRRETAASINRCRIALRPAELHDFESTAASVLFRHFFEKSLQGRDLFAVGFEIARDLLVDVRSSGIKLMR